MAFLATKLHPNSSVSQAHKVHRIEITDGVAKVIVNSFATEAALSAVPAQLVWQDSYDIPLAAVADVEAFLISDEGSFPGGAKLLSLIHI
mgnify:FL=1